MHHIQLSGGHNFSRYVLAFTVDERPDATVLRARSHAQFPGPFGRVYRALVIGSGAHRVVVWRMLRAVRRQAEGPSRSSQAQQT